MFVIAQKKGENLQIGKKASMDPVSGINEGVCYMFVKSENKSVYVANNLAASIGIFQTRIKIWCCFSNKA